MIIIVLVKKFQMKENLLIYSGLRNTQDFLRGDETHFYLFKFYLFIHLFSVVF